MEIIFKIDARGEWVYLIALHLIKGNKLRYFQKNNYKFFSYFILMTLRSVRLRLNE